MPAQAAIFKNDNSIFVRERDSGPASLGTRRHPGQHRGARPFQQKLPWPNVSGTRLLSGIMQVGILPGAPKISDDVKVAWPSVKRLVVVRVHVGEPFPKWNGARPVGRGSCLENSNTFNGVQGSSPWRSAIFVDQVRFRSWIFYWKGFSNFTGLRLKSAVFRVTKVRL